MKTALFLSATNHRIGEGGPRRHTACCGGLEGPTGCPYVASPLECALQDERSQPPRNLPSPPAR
jgi:hypothetical protein